MIKLSNELLEITIRNTGAELTRIFHKQFLLDYLWDGDPEFWGKHAPVLFPFVGGLKDNTYFHNGTAYSMNRHGFARDRDFALLSKNDHTAVFECLQDEKSLTQYPFCFSLKIGYTLSDNTLENRYELTNTGTGDMLFSIGGHPAFHVPLGKQGNYPDYFLEFDEPETLSRWPIRNNLISTHPETVLINDKTIPLSHGLFKNDALVFKHPRSRYLSLKNTVSEHGLTMRIEEFPYLGIWAAPDAPFVCIEPWQGLADSVYHNQQLVEKEGIVLLPQGQTWTGSWDISFW